MFHGVADDIPQSTENSWQPSWPRPTKCEFSSLLRWLNQSTTVISMGSAVAQLRGDKTVASNALVLSFDDGYLNNATCVAPLLVEHNTPAIFYLTTKGLLSGEHRYWIDRLDFVLQKLQKPSQAIVLKGQSFTVQLHERRAFEQSYKAFRMWVKALYDDDVQMLNDLDHLIERLETEAGASICDLKEDCFSRVMSASEANGLPDLVSIGSHTVNHFRATHIPQEQFAEELEQSYRDLLQNIVNHQPRHFCFPNGNYNDAVVESVRGSSFESAVTVERGTNKIGCDVYRLRRISIGRPASRAELIYNLSMAYLKNTR